ASVRRVEENASMRLYPTPHIWIGGPSLESTSSDPAGLLDTVPDILIADDWDPELDDTEPMLDLPNMLADSSRVPDAEFSEAPTLPGVERPTRPGIMPRG